MPKQKILRATHFKKCPKNVDVPIWLCLTELYCMVPTAQADESLEALAIIFRDSLGVCNVLENLKDSGHLRVPIFEMLSKKTES